MAVSFKADVLPLFRQVDIAHMKPMGVLLDNYQYMSDPAGDGGDFADHANARNVFCRLSGTTCGPRMPPGGPFWTPEQLQIFQDWMDGGFQP